MIHTYMNIIMTIINVSMAILIRMMVKDMDKPRRYESKFNENALFYRGRKWTKEEAIRNLKARQEGHCKNTHSEYKEFMEKPLPPATQEPQRDSPSYIGPTEETIEMINALVVYNPQPSIEEEEEDTHPSSLIEDTFESEPEPQPQVEQEQPSKIIPEFKQPKTIKEWRAFVGDFISYKEVSGLPDKVIIKLMGTTISTLEKYATEDQMNKWMDLRRQAMLNKRPNQRNIAIKQSLGKNLFDDIEPKPQPIVKPAESIKTTTPSPQQSYTKICRG